MAKVKKETPHDQIVDYYSNKYYDGGYKDEIRKKLTSDEDLFNEALNVIHKDHYSNIPIEEFKNKYKDKYGDPFEKKKMEESKLIVEEPSKESGIGSGQNELSNQNTQEQFPFLKDNRVQASESTGQNYKLKIPSSQEQKEYEQALEFTPKSVQEDQKREAELKAMDNGIGRGMSALGTFNQSVYNIPADILDALAIGSNQIGRLTESLGIEDRVPFENQYAHHIAEKYRNFISELAPSNPAYQDELTTQVAGAAGNLAGLVLTGAGNQVKNTSTLLNETLQLNRSSNLLSNAISQGKEVFSTPPALLGAIQQGESEFKNAKAAGASDDEAFGAFVKNAMAGGVLEAIPVLHYLKRLDTISGGGVKNALKTGVAQGIEEMSTEVTQQVFANVNAANTYDKTREWYDGVKESGSIGFGLGFFLGATGKVLIQKQEEASSPEEKAEIQKAIDFITEKQNDLKVETEKVQKLDDETSQQPTAQQVPAEQQPAEQVQVEPGSNTLPEQQESTGERINTEDNQSSIIDESLIHSIKLGLKYGITPEISAQRTQTGRWVPLINIGNLGHLYAEKSFENKQDAIDFISKEIGSVDQGTELNNTQEPQLLNEEVRPQIEATMAPKQLQDVQQELTQQVPEDNMLSRIEKLNPNESDGYNLDKLTSFKQELLENPEKAKVALGIFDFVNNSKLWGEDLHKSFNEKPLTHLQMFYYGDSNSIDQFVETQIADEQRFIDKAEGQIKELKNTKSDKKSKEILLKDIDKTKDRISKIENAYKEYKATENLDSQVNENESTIIPSSELAGDLSEEQPKPQINEQAYESSDNNNVPPEVNETSLVPDEEKKERSFPKQILNDAEISDEIKNGLSENALTYIPKSNKLTAKEAKAIIDAKGLDNAYNDLTDKSNDIAPRVRVVLAENLIKKLNQEAKESTSETAKNKALDQAIKTADFISEYLTELGQGVQAASVYTKLSPDGVIRYVERKLKEVRKKVIETRGDIKEKKDLFDQINEETIDKLLSDPKIKNLIENRLIPSKRAARKKAVNDAVSFLEKLKVDTKGKAFDASYGIPVTIWNGAISTLQATLTTSENIITAVEKAVQYIKENHKGDWDEKGFRERFEEDLKKYDVVLNPERAVKRGLKDLGTSIREVVRKHYTQADTIKATLTEKLVKESGLTDADAKELATTIQEAFAKIATKEKEAALKREFKGKEKLQSKLSKSIDEKLIELTNLGALSQEDFNKVYAEKLGIKQLTDSDKKRLMELSEVVQDADNFAEEAENNFSDENLRKYVKSQEKKLQAVNEIAEILSDKLPKDVWDTLSTVLQGNLLTPISIVTNVYSNILLQPLRFASKLSAQGMDMLFSKVTGKPRMIDVVASSKGYKIGMKEGLIKGQKELKTGTQIDEIRRLEIARGFKPVKALLAGLDRKQAQTIEERINNLIEGTVGMPAEAMFRLLNLGDKPFQRAAEVAKAYEIAKLKGLEGKDLAKFLVFPDAESADMIRQAGEEATFKSSDGPGELASRVTSNLYKALSNVPVIGGPAKFLLKTQVPYVKTPVNILVETFDYALPQLSFAKALYYSAKKNRVKAMEYFGKAAVGVMLQTVAGVLIQNGLLSGDPEDDKKERALQNLAFPAKGLNYSGLMRLLNGGDPSHKKDDTFITYEKMGVPGVILNMRANLGAKKILEGKEFSNFLDEMMYDTFSSIPNAASTALEMSFLQGANTFLDAVSKNDWDNWLSNTFNAITSVPLPNTLSSVNRATREYVPELRDDDLMTRLNNVIKGKIFMDGDYPKKIDLWGNKIKQSPTGRNPFAYQLIDVTKFRDIASDDLSLQVFKLWKETGDSDMIPSIPSRNFSYDGKKTKLNYGQYEKLLEFVGKARKNLLEDRLNDEDFKNLSNEDKVKTVKELYDEGLQIGKDQLVENNFFRLLNTKK